MDMDEGKTIDYRLEVTQLDSRSTVSEILPVFYSRATFRYPTQNFGLFFLDVGVYKERRPWATQPWNYFSTIPAYVITISYVTDKQTDGRTICQGNTALYSVAR